MFKNPFSFYGRIRRLEYGLSIIIMYAYFFLVGVFMGILDLPESTMFLFLIPAYWFSLAQGAKRCHDRGNTGWYQIIPFYGLWMLFAGSDYGMNDYGPNPKGEGNEDIEDMIESIGVAEQD